MIQKHMKRILNKNSFFILTILLLSMSILSTVDAHILIVGDSTGDLPDERKETIAIYNKLVSDGYPVICLIGENATAEKIIKGMYGADAVIYVGHGSDLGFYQNDGGVSRPPYCIPTYDEVGIWTSKNILSEGLNFWGLDYNGKFIPPFKKGASVVFLHTCFATGWVEDTLVSNPDETIYNFNLPYVNAGANVYSTGYYQVYNNIFDGVLGQELDNGGETSISFKKANDNLINMDDKVDTNSYKEYNSMEFYSNDNYDSLFIGNLNSSVLPKAEECSEYNYTSAKKWYDSGKPTNDTIYDESISFDNLNDDAYSNDLFDLFFNYLGNFFDYILGVNISYFSY